MIPLLQITRACLTHTVSPTLCTSRSTTALSFADEVAILSTSVIFASIDVIFVSIEASLSSSLLSMEFKEPIFGDCKLGIFFSIAASLSSRDLSAEFPVAELPVADAAADIVVAAAAGAAKFPSPCFAN
jgi:hypothetical protein